MLFRWKYSDDVDTTERWSGWHVVSGPCSVCCCGGGPDKDGEHQEPAEHYDVDGFLEPGHSCCDPVEDADWREIEFKESK